MIQLSADSCPLPFLWLSVTQAATIIILWWKTRKNLELTRKQEELDAQMLRKEFLQYKLDTMQEVEDLQNMSHKLDRVAHRFKVRATRIRTERRRHRRLRGRATAERASEREGRGGGREEIGEGERLRIKREQESESA